MNQKNPIDELFQSKLGHYQVDAPMHVWSAIENKRGLIKQSRFKILRKRVLLYAAVALLALGTTFLFTTYIGQETNLFLGSLPIPEHGSGAYGPEAGIAQPGVSIQEDETEPQNVISKRSTVAEELNTKIKAKVHPVIEKSTSEIKSLTPGIVYEHGTDIKVKGMPTAESKVFERLEAFEPIEGIQPEIKTLFQKPHGELKCAKFLNRKSSWYVSAMASPEFAFKEINAKDPDYEGYASERMRTESPRYAYSLGFRLSTVSPFGLAFRTGINYTQINEQFSYLLFEEKTVITEVKDSEGNVVYTDSSTVTNRLDITHNNQFKLIDVPLLLGYEMDHEKFTFAANAGVLVNLSFNQEGKMLSHDALNPVQVNSGFEDEYKPFKSKIDLGWYGSLSMLYHLNGGLSVMLEPHFRIYPKSITQDNYVLDQRYFLGGISLGLRKRLF